MPNHIRNLIAALLVFIYVGAATQEAAARTENILCHIEVTYPASASSSSWKSLSFNSYVRAGGEANDPKGEYGVSSINNGTEYFVCQS